MKILADENIEKPVVVKLRAEGHEVLHVLEIAPGITDIAVLRLANQENAVVLTEDKDFGGSGFPSTLCGPRCNPGKITRKLLFERESGDYSSDN